jgi:hypothetical protein
METMDPNDVIDTIIDAIDYAEITQDPEGLTKARRLLRNELRQVIDQYVQAEVSKVQGRRALRPTLSRQAAENAPWQNVLYR